MTKCTNTHRHRHDGSLYIGADKIFLSQDSEFGGSLLPAATKEWREKIDPPDGMLFNTRKLIPYLKRLGVTDQEIRTITVDNPRRFFGRA